jgi:hypothetical protein
VWHNNFTEKRPDLENDKLAYRPVSFQADKNGEKMRTLVRTDSRLRIRITSEEMHVNKGRIRQTSTTNLNMKCVRKGSQNSWVKKLSVEREIPTLKHAPYSSHHIFQMRFLLYRKFDISFHSVLISK